MGSVTNTPASTPTAVPTSTPTLAPMPNAAGNPTATPMANVVGQLGTGAPGTAPMTSPPPQDWQTQLAPPHAPPPTGWWPLAPGWWILLVVLLAGATFAVLWPRRPPVRLRRAALRELDQLGGQTGSDADLARQLEHLVRRVAIARYGRASVAGLAGARWIDFVVAHGGADWSGDVGAGLLRAAYGGAAGAAGTSSSERARWLSGARAFFKAKK